MRRYCTIAAIILIPSLLSGVADAAILRGSQVLDAGQNMTVDLRINTTTDTVGIIMTGPEAVWFGIGMQPLNHPSGDSTYTVNALGGAAAPTVQEWSLGVFGPGSQLPDTLTVDSNTVDAGVRTVELSGPRDGANYSYPTAPQTIDISWAYGNGETFAIHAGRGETTLTLIPEPSTVLLMGIAGLGVCLARRKH